MAEEWRVKRYYQPRVLIGVQDTLECSFPATLLCLEGSELNILRNLVQYAHRRATWVSEYHPSYYLAPSTEEWDQIESLVAGLEEKLMGCAEIVELLESILAAASCACDAGRQTVFVSNASQPVVQEFLDSGTLVTTDSYGEEQPVNEERCAVAQLVYQCGWELLTEVMIPLQNTLFDMLMPQVIAQLALLCGSLEIGIPVGVLLAVLWGITEVWVSGELESVQNAYESYKTELVCAVYDGLATNYRQAEQNALEVIGDMEGVGYVDKVLFHTIFSPWAMHLAQIAYDNETDWAVANVVEGFCTACQEPLYGHWLETDWPPCPDSQNYFLDGGVCWLYGADNRLCFNGDIPSAHCPFETNLYPFNRVEFYVSYYSKFGSGFTVGGFAVDKWDTETETWVQIANQALTTSQPAGTLNISTSDVDITEEGEGLYRMRIGGMAGQHDEAPYPLMMNHTKMRLWDIPPP